MLITLLFRDKNICCGYALEGPQRGASNEYPQHVFSSRNKKNIMRIPPPICSYEYPVILLMNSEGPDQTVQADLGLCCPHMLEDMFSHGMAHLTSLYVSL